MFQISGDFMEKQTEEFSPFNTVISIESRSLPLAATVNTHLSRVVAMTAMSVTLMQEAA